MPKAQFRQRLVSPMINTYLPNLNSLLNLDNIISDGALHAHLNGDDAEALERLFDTLHLARILRQDEFLVSQLIANGIDAATFQKVMTIAPALRLDVAAATRPATSQRVREMIALLLYENDVQAHFRATLLNERVTFMDATDVLSEGTWAIRPLADVDRLRACDHLDAVLNALASGTEPPPLTPTDWEFAPDPSPRAGSVTLLPRTPRYSRWFSLGTAHFGKVLAVHRR